jgi:osmotically inducible lipoprotein OsmB
MSSYAMVLIVCSVTFATGLSACSSTPTRQQVGIGTGAVAGGVLGNVITGGSSLGTVGGAAAGGLIGNQLSK